MLCNATLAALLGASLTAAWLYAPFGTTYPEQTAFCAILIGLTLILAASVGNRRRWANSALLVLAGLMAVTGVLSKHNAGLLGVGLHGFVIIALLAHDWRRCLISLAWFTLGVVLGGLAFTAWLLVYADGSAFVYHVVTIPGELGMERLFGEGLPSFVKRLLTGKGTRFLRVLAIHWACLFGVAAVLYRRERRFVAAMMIGIALIGYQNAFSMVSFNDAANEKPFLGLLFGLALSTVQVLSLRSSAGLPRSMMVMAPAVALILTVLVRTGTILEGMLLTIAVLAGVGGFQPARVSERLWPRLVSVSVLGVFVVLQCEGVAVSIDRQVHDSFGVPTRTPILAALERECEFDQTVAAPGLRGLGWGAPTVVNGTTVSAAELDRLIAHLQQRQKPFFTFPDFTFLYAGLGARSPQPLLWFHKGLTYSQEYSAELDRKIVQSLRSNGVETIVLENNSMACVQGSLADFPMLRTFLEQEFEPAATIGFFGVYHRRPEARLTRGPARALP
jgi:hypothetical protein